MTAAISTDIAETIAELWRRGDLSWKLDAHQLDVYAQYVEWNARRQTDEYLQLIEDTEAEYDDVFVHEAGRRVGKTHEWLTIAMELALQRPGAHLTYATAFQKDIAEIIVPLADIICADAPDDTRPKYQQSHRESHEGLYFPNGSVIKLVGVDKHKDALRGRFSDGFFFSEAGFIRGLKYLLRSVVLPQFQRRPWAFCVLESSTPEQIDHDLLVEFAPDAVKRRAYRMQTIDENKEITEREKAKALRQAGGRGSPDCEREYYCVPSRDPNRTVLPEYDEDRHVVDPRELPPYAHCYVGMDPGTRDQFAIGWAYWDFERAKLVVQRSFAKSNITTTPVADLLRVTERELWGDLRYWNGRDLKPNPYLRVSDTASQVIIDLSLEHGLTVSPTAKDDAEAQLYSLRNAFMADKIEIWRDSGPLAGQCKTARWNENRTDWERTSLNGHSDCVAMLMYMWRNVVRTLNPYPPQHIGKDPGAYHSMQFGKQQLPTEARAIQTVFSSGNRFRPQRRTTMRAR